MDFKENTTSKTNLLIPPSFYLNKTQRMKIPPPDCRNINVLCCWYLHDGKLSWEFWIPLTSRSTLWPNTTSLTRDCNGKLYQHQSSIFVRISRIHSLIHFHISGLLAVDIPVRLIWIIHRKYFRSLEINMLSRGHTFLTLCVQEFTVKSGDDFQLH